MKRNRLWQVSVLTTREAEDAAAELLESTFSQPVSSYTDAETQATTVSVYVRDAAEWTWARRERLAFGLKRIAASGLDVGPGRLRLEPVPRAGWAQSWKRHFKPLAIGRSLLLKPSWSRRRAREGQAVVVIDPGLSFGTGQHPTTAFCLRQLVAWRRPGKPQSCLDVGTGSGILAIAAAKLGYSPVEAFDFDPQAVAIAKANARRNGVSAKVRLTRQDLTRLPRRARKQYSIVCANLVATLLLEERDSLLARVAPDGVLVVAGILKTEFPRVRRAFATAGLKLSASAAGGEWRSGAFVWPQL